MAKYGEAGIRPLPFAHCQPDRARGLPARHIGRRSPGPSLKDDHVVRTFIADEPRDSPPRAVDEFLDLGRGCEQVVEPGVHQVAISDAYTELTRHAVSPTVPLQIGEMRRILSRVRVVAGSHDPVRESAEAPEQSATVPPATEETEVVPVHHDGSEVSEATRQHLRDASDERLGHRADARRQRHLPTGRSRRRRARVPEAPAPRDPLRIQRRARDR